MSTDAREAGSKDTLERKTDQLSEIKGDLLGKLDEPLAPTPVLSHPRNQNKQAVCRSLGLKETVKFVDTLWVPVAITTPC